MRTLVLVRHGESVWNSEGLFTGWVDVGLSPKGVDEAVNCGRLLDEAGLGPRVVATPVPAPAIPTGPPALESAGPLLLAGPRALPGQGRHIPRRRGAEKGQTPAAGVPWPGRRPRRGRLRSRARAGDIAGPGGRQAHRQCPRARLSVDAGYRASEHLTNNGRSETSARCAAASCALPSNRGLGGECVLGRYAC